MPGYIRVRHEVTGHEYDKTAGTPLRDGEVKIDHRRAHGRSIPPKFRRDKAGKPTSPRPKSSPAPVEEPKAAEPADTEKE